MFYQYKSGKIVAIDFTNIKSLKPVDIDGTFKVEILPKILDVRINYDLKFDTKDERDSCYALIVEYLKKEHLLV